MEWTTFVNLSQVFSNAVDKVKRILVLFGVVFATASYFYFLNCGPRSLISSFVL